MTITAYKWTPAERQWLAAHKIETIGKPIPIRRSRRPK